ncbi:unnamed protein product, partial [Fusarium graminearum]
SSRIIKSTVQCQASYKLSLVASPSRPIGQSAYPYEVSTDTDTMAFTWEGSSSKTLYPYYSPNQTR